MAATYKDNGGSVNGSNKVFTYDFPALQTEDIKVALNGVTQATTKYTASLSPANITFNNTSVDSTVQETDGSPKSGVTVRVYRETTVGKASGDEDPKAVFAAGSSIRAGDLNANVEQALFGIHELQEQPIQSEQIQDDAIITSKIKDDAVTLAKLNSGALPTDITIASANINNDAIDSQHYAADSIDQEHYAPNSIYNEAVHPNAEIEVSKLKDGAPRQLLQTDSGGSGVEWTNNVDVPGTLDVTGATTLDGTSTGNLAINSNKFNVNATSGDTTVAGTLGVTGATQLQATGVDGNFDINTNKFTVAAATGNTVIAGNLDVSGQFDVTGTSNYTGQQTVPGGALVKNIRVGLDAATEVSTTSGNLTLDSAGGTVVVDDNLSVNGTTSANAINAAGAVGVDGDFDVNTNKFTVASSTGNTTVGGTLGVTGTITGNVTGNITGNTSGNAGTATALETARNIGGVSFNGTANIDLPGVNTAGNQNTSGNAGTATDLAAAAKITNSEQGAHSANDTTYFTTSASDARYFNISSGDTIKDGQTFPDNDTTIATTAAINDRIIDLVDDVGGFVPIANETSFPNANPDVNNGTGTLVSIKALASNLTSNGSGVATIANGTVGNSTVTINGLANSTTYTAGYGLIVETTTTLNTYSFHRQVPKATEVTTVAGSISNVNTVAGDISNVNAVAGNATNINAVAADASDIGAVAGKATEIGRLGTADAVSDMNTLGTNAIVSDMDTLADISANITTVAGISANVTTVAGNNSNVTAVAGNNSNITSVAGNATNINSAVSNASNINTTAGSISNVNTVAGSISNVNTTAGSISNVNTVASNISNVNNFNDKYQIASSNPGTDGGGNALAAGDLFFNTSANELKVYNGSSWQGGVTASGNFASTTGNTFTGDNIHNDNVNIHFGTNSDTSVYHNDTNFYLDNDKGDIVIRANVAGDVGGNILLQPHDDEDGIKIIHDGNIELYANDQKKLEVTSAGITVTGTVIADNLDVGTDVDVDGTLEADAITVNGTALNEYIADTVGDMVTSNTESGITVAYDDNDNTLDFTISTQTDNNFTTALKNKLDGIEASATADQSNAEIRAAVEAASDSNVFTDADHSKLNAIEASATADQTAAEIKTLLNSNGIVNSQVDGSAAIAGSKIDPDFGSQTVETTGGASIGQNIVVGGTVDGRDVASDGSKLDGIESGATADQSNAEIRAAVEAASDSNVFTDADHSKLNGIAASANNYSHPSHNGDDFSVDTGALSGATVVSDIDINVTTDSSGHVTDANGSVSTRTLTLGNLGYSGATNANYITNNNQLTNGAGYVTSSGNTVIGTDSDIDTSGSTIIDNLYMTDGVITSHGTRTLTLGNLGFTGATNANYITNNNQLSNGAGYVTSAGATSFSGLSDYATGNWTPAPNWSSGSSAYGYYVRTGNIVHCWGYIDNMDDNSSSAMRINGLPYTSVNSGASKAGGASFYFTT